MNIEVTISIIAVLVALATVQVRDGRLAVILLWTCGLLAGTICLLAGAELVAISQWLMSTIVAIILILYTILFGSEKKPPGRVFLGLSIFCGLLISVVLFLGLKDGVVYIFGESKDSLTLAIKVGTGIVHNGALGIFLMAMTLLVVVVGVGATSRQERIK